MEVVIVQLTLDCQGKKVLELKEKRAKGTFETFAHLSGKRTENEWLRK